MTTVVKQYVRDKKGNPRGLVLAITEEDSNVVHVGWSFCSKRDHFDKTRAHQIASGRAETGTDKTMPHLVVKEFDRFFDRLKRFLKTDDIKVSGPIQVYR